MSSNQDKPSIIFNVKFPVSSFIGKEQELEDLHINLQRNKATKSHAVVISGLGGIGKTELARKYISKYGKCYDNIIWINAESETSIRKCFRDLSEETPKISVENEDDEVKIIKRACKYLSESKTLFVFDDADKNEVFCSFLTQLQLASDAEKQCVIITSRNRHWDWEDTDVIILRELTRQDAINLVKMGLKIEDNTEDGDVQHLVKLLDGFPLAIQQAIAYIRVKRYLKNFKTKDYLDRFGKQTKVLLDSKLFRGIDIDYTKTSFTTWTRTLEIIANIEPNGDFPQKCLNYMAYIAPEAIEISMLSSMIKSDVQHINFAVNLLVDFNMVEKQNSNPIVLSINQLVQTVTRLKLKEKGNEEAILNKLVSFINTLPTEEKCTHHINHVCRHASQYKNISLNLLPIYGTTKESPLHLLSMDGDIKAIKAFLKHLEEEQPDKLLDVINMKNFYGETALHKAAYYRHLHVIKYLVQEKHIDFSVKNKEGDTAYFTAAYEGHLDIVKYFMTNQMIKHDEVNDNKNTFLHAAAHSGNLDLVEYLVKENLINSTAKNKDGRYPLHISAFRGHLDIVIFFIESLKVDYHTVDNFGNFISHQAALSGNMDLVKYLVKKNFDFSWENDNHENALFSAALKGHLHVVKYFIENLKVEYNATNIYGENVLFAAAQSGNVQLVKYLIDKNVGFLAQNVNGDNVLFVAASKGHFGIVKFFIEKLHMDYNAHNINGDNIMHLAALENNLDLIRYLVTKNIDIHVKNKFGKTPLHVAASKGHYHVVEYFIEELNADCGVTDIDGRNTLQHAMSSKNIYLIKYVDDCISKQTQNN